MEMAIALWLGRGFFELIIWTARWPERMNREWLRYFALPHAVGTLAEVATHAVVVGKTGGEIGSHAIWMSFVAYYVYHVVMWPLCERDEEGNLPKPGAFLLESLMYPFIMWLVPLG